MRNLKICVLVLILVPVLGMAQLKKDIPQPNISGTLNSSLLNSALLDPSKFSMHHSFSMSYFTMGGTDMMLNTYVNTLNYSFSENLFLTTRLGIMASPYNNLPGDNALANGQFFGGAELKYLPTENTVISLKFESVPYMYRRNSLYHMRDRYNLQDYGW